MLIASVALATGGLAIIAAGLMAGSGKLTRNSVVGIRTGTTMASDEAWYAAHDVAASWIVAGGAVMVLGGIGVAFIESEDTAGWFAIATAAIGLIPLSIGGLKGQRAAGLVNREGPGER